MKIKTFNKKIFKEKIESIGTNKVKEFKTKIKSVEQHIPLEFFKSNGSLSIENTLNILPTPIKNILENGNNPISIKSNSSIIEIKTDTGLSITVKTSSIDDKVPQVKIFDKDSKTELLNTYKR